MSLQPRALHALGLVRSTREQHAAAVLAEAEARLNEQHQRARELDGYLADYERPGAAVSAALLANRAQFIARLREAMVAQQHALQQAEAAVESARSRYLQVRQDRRAIDRLKEDQHRRERASEQHRQQKQIDDWSATCAPGQA